MSAGSAGIVGSATCVSLERDKWRNVKKRISVAADASTTASALSIKTNDAIVSSRLMAAPSIAAHMSIRLRFFVLAMTYLLSALWA